MTSLHDPLALESLRKELRLHPHDMRRMRTAMMRTFRGVDGALSEWPEAVREAARGKLRFHHLALTQRRDSQLDGASKLLFETDDGKAIETVILRAKTGRTTLCVSSQTACAVGCVFCATGRLKGLRNLSKEEILDQVMQAGEILRGEKRMPRNVVFMGMGEPMHNEEVLHEVLRELGTQGAFHLSDAHLLVSTSGIPEAMVRLAQAFPKVGQALSLHSVRQDIREKLVPMARRHPLAQLRAALEALNALQERDVMIEYLMFDGLTDTVDDLEALKEFLHGLRVHINLIPFNAIDATPGVRVGDETLSLRPTPDARFQAFLQALKDAGFTATRRYSLGADIAAACGQLARKAGDPA